MKKYKAFIVPFATKGYLNNDNHGYKLLGRAYYLYDKNFKIYKQFIQLDEANFRPTDKEMLVTSYYNNKSVGIQTIRKTYLEQYQQNLGYIKAEISKKEKIRINLPKDLLNQINKQLIKLSRVKKSIDVFTGSNSSGAEQNAKASSIITYYKEDFSNSGYNFSNPFNRSEIYKENKNIKIDSLNQLEIIKMYDFLKLSHIANSIFKEYNFSQYYIFKDISKSISYSSIINGIETENRLNKISNSKSENNVRKLLEKTIENFKKENFENENENKKIERKLRNIQKLLVTFEVKKMQENSNILDSNELFNSLTNCYDANSEFCHIIPVKDSKKDFKRYFEIADNNNCLLLPPNIHKNYDNFQIFFDENSGNCIILNNNKVVENKCIKKEWMTSKRKKYLKMYKENYVKII